MPVRPGVTNPNQLMQPRQQQNPTVLAFPNLADVLRQRGNFLRAMFNPAQQEAPAAPATPRPAPVPGMSPEVAAEFARRRALLGAPPPMGMAGAAAPPTAPPMGAPGAPMGAPGMLPKVPLNFQGLQSLQPQPAAGGWDWLMQSMR